MPHADVAAAIEAYLVPPRWSECPVIGLNTTAEVPSDGSDYMMLQYEGARAKRMVISHRVYRESGTIRCVLFTQRGIGTGPALARASHLATIMRDRTVSGVRLLVPDPPNLGDFNDEGAYFVLAVLVPYTFSYRELDP